MATRVWEDARIGSDAAIVVGRVGSWLASRTTERRYENAKVTGNGFGHPEQNTNKRWIAESGRKSDCGDCSHRLFAPYGAV